MYLKLDVFRAHVMAQFRALRDFHVHSEAQLQESHKTLRSELKGAVKIPPAAGEEEVHELLSARFDEIDECERQYKVVFARLLRFSAVVMCFTLVEANLSRIAREMVDRKELALNLEDLQAKNLVKRFQKFWTKVANLQWWQDEDRWNLLKEVEKLRHCIVHRNGVLRENEKRIHQLVAKNVGVRVLSANDEHIDPDDIGALGVEERFCRHMIEELTELFREVFDRAECFGPENPVIE